MGEGRNLKRLLWAITATGVGITAAGFVIGGIAVAGGAGDTGDTGDADVAMYVGVVALCVGLAVCIYAAVQWVTYFRATRR